VHDFILQRLAFSLEAAQHTSAAVKENLSLKQPVRNSEFAVYLAGLFLPVNT